MCSNLQCSYLLKTRQHITLQVVREHCNIFPRVREFMRERETDLVAVTRRSNRSYSRIGQC
jgi:hypothetical protein